MTDLSVLGPASATGAPTLVDGIRASLREAIAKGALPAGFRLREIPLAEHFGCSTTPVREAIRKLEHEGLVKVYPRRGAEVTSVTSTEVEHLYETRMVLECYATRKAAENRPTTATLAPARRVLERQKQSLADGTADPDDPQSLLDADFHRELTALCGNPMIAELVERATRQIEAVQARSHAGVKEGVAPAVKAHTAILSAVAKGQSERAESLMREHLIWTGNAVAASLESAASTR